MRPERSARIRSDLRPLLSALCVFFVVLLAVALSKEFTLHIAPVAREQGQASGLLPVRLVIPAINLDATIEHVGLAADGTMATPERPDGVAWYELGVRPGQIGSAVIDGHSGWKDGRAAAFDALYKLHAGDNIYVEDGMGTTVIFIVREIRSYEPTADASAVFISHAGGRHLNLITCEGVWDAETKSYSKRLVVFADWEQ